MVVVVGLVVVVVGLAVVVVVGFAVVVVVGLAVVVVVGFAVVVVTGAVVGVVVGPVGMVGASVAGAAGAVEAVDVLIKGATATAKTIADARIHRCLLIVMSSPIAPEEPRRRTGCQPVEFPSIGEGS